MTEQDAHNDENEQLSIERDKKGRWVKGQSGNPKGGTRLNLHTVVRNEIKSNLPDLVERIVEQAKDGCVKSQEMLLNKVLPNMKSKDLPHNLELPKVLPKDISSLLDTMTSVLNEALNDNISNSQAESLLKQMESVRSTYEAEFVQKELEELKEAIK